MSWSEDFNASVEAQPEKLDSEELRQWRVIFSDLSLGYTLRLIIDGSLLNKILDWHRDQVKAEVLADLKAEDFVL